jgi:hypothetical protein
VNECGGDHQVGRPAVNGTDQPAEPYLGHNELHAFESCFSSGPVIKQQQNTGKYLYYIKE